MSEELRVLKFVDVREIIDTTADVVIEYKLQFDTDKGQLMLAVPRSATKELASCLADALSLRLVAQE